MRTVVRHKMRCLAVVLVALLGVSLAGFIATNSSHDGGEAYVSPNRKAAPLEFDYKRVAYIGDDYTVGVGAAERNGYSFQMNRRNCWSANNNGQSGTGYVNPGTGFGYSAFPDRIEDALANNPELIFIQGGTADEGYPGVFEAAFGLFDELRHRAPTARLVVIGPIEAGAQDSAELLGVRDSVRDAAEANGALFIDPISDSWEFGPAGFSNQGIPSQLTHTTIADYVSTALGASGLTELQTCDPVA